MDIIVIQYAQNIISNLMLLKRSFDSRNDVYIWIIQNQLGRRNLPHFARAELRTKIKTFFPRKRFRKQKELLGNYMA